MITALIIVFLVKFQSTLPRRERQSLEIYLILLCNFNPHSHEGSDKDHHNDLQSVVDFNPHSHEGSDGKTITGTTPVSDFNPHSHEGSDGYIKISSIIPANFNPHSHEGSDIFITYLLLYFFQFQSTLPRRERRNSEAYSVSVHVFQSTLPRRERQQY